MGVSDQIFLFGTLFPDMVRKFWPYCSRFLLASKRNPRCVYGASLCIVLSESKACLSAGAGTDMDMEVGEICHWVRAQAHCRRVEQQLGPALDIIIISVISFLSTFVLLVILIHTEFFCVCSHFTSCSAFTALTPWSWHLQITSKLHFCTSKLHWLAAPKWMKIKKCKR